MICILLKVYLIELTHSIRYDEYLLNCPIILIVEGNHQGVSVLTWVSGLS